MEYNSILVEPQAIVKSRPPVFRQPLFRLAFQFFKALGNTLKL
jgi:hypothetical protein